MQLRDAIFILSLLLGAVQSSGAPARQGQVLTRQLAEAQSSPILRADGESQQFQLGGNWFEQQADEEMDFTRRLNRLQSALREFSTTYNSGHVIDVKKVKAVRKAWLDLEKTGWFRGEKPK